MTYDLSSSHDMTQKEKEDLERIYRQVDFMPQFMHCEKNKFFLVIRQCGRDLVQSEEGMKKDS